MPQYEYECQTCGHKFEVMAKVDDPDPRCPECSSEDVKRVPSRNTFQLKGGGWASDGYSS